jgi:hypothetical protein
MIYLSRRHGSLRGSDGGFARIALSGPPPAIHLILTICT